MPDLNEFLPKQSDAIVQAIYTHYKQVGDSEPARGYLGASIIGHPCERYLWFNFRQCCKEEFPGRLYRLFQTGHLAEERFAADLMAIGCTVHTLDADGGQFAISALGGHFSGHMDGCVLGVLGAEKTWHVFEGKTHNNKNFKKLTKDGVQVAFPKHYAQMMTYMHYTGMKRALYVAVNKDTDELYIERIRYDADQAAPLVQRAKRVITSMTPPEGISDRRDFWQCKFCPAKDVCHETLSVSSQVLKLPSLSCRQCCHATPMMDGVQRWMCEKHKKSLSPTDQDNPCDDHLILPGILAGYEPVEAGLMESDRSDFIHFESEDGAVKFTNGRGPGTFSSRELMVVNRTGLTSPMVVKAKETFDGTVTSCCKDILDRYPRERCSILWEGRISELTAAWDSLRVPWEGYNDVQLSAMSPINQMELPTHQVAEYGNGVIVVVHTLEKRAEILQKREEMSND